MPELGKVINAWEHCTDIVGESTCDDCPYNNEFNGCLLYLKIDTIELLKKQLPTKALTKNRYWAVCNDCGNTFRKFMMPAKKAKYCPECGKKIEWIGSGC